MKLSDNYIYRIISVSFSIFNTNSFNSPVYIYIRFIDINGRNQIKLWIVIFESSNESVIKWAHYQVKSTTEYNSTLHCEMFNFKYCYSENRVKN